MYKIELDIVINDDETPGAFAARMCKRFDLQAQVISEVGPAGGWPLISFAGERDHLINLINYIDRDEEGDAQQRADMIALIVPVEA